MEVINVCSQISLGLKLSTFTMSFSIKVLPPLNKEQKITLLLILHPNHQQVQTCRFLVIFGAASGTGQTQNKQHCNKQSGLTPSVFLWQALGLAGRLHFFAMGPVRVRDAIECHSSHWMQKSSRLSSKTVGAEYKEKAFAACSHRAVSSSLIYFSH